MLAPKNILVATDFSDTSISALAYGRVLARAFGARLHILHVVEAFSMDSAVFGTFAAPVVAVEAELESAAREALDKMVTDEDRRELSAVVALRVLDTPAHAIVQYSGEEQIDLIVVGTHGRTGLSHMLMGSVAEKVVRMSTCPVLTVRHPAREVVRAEAVEMTTQMAQ